MYIQDLGNYQSIILDYSFLREFGGTSLFTQFYSTISSSNSEIYVGSNFKLFHSCLVHQADDKDEGTCQSFRDLCMNLLAAKKFHEIAHLDTGKFLESASMLDNPCILTTFSSILLKRIIEYNYEVLIPIVVVNAEGLIRYENSHELIEANALNSISSLAFNNSFLDIDVYCSVNDIVYTANMEPVRLEKRLNNGAEGMVFLTDKSGVVAKIFHKDIITPLRWAKLTRMVSMGIKSVGICWPQDLLFNSGTPVGNTMSLGKGKTLSTVFDGPDAIIDCFPNWMRVDVVDTAINLLEKYIYLHMHDILAGDIQLKNALISSSSSVFLIDMDSCQIGNLPCPVGTEEFTDTALWGKNFAHFLREMKNEDYSLAMLVFSILFCGLNPYASRHGKETLREEILDKNFPYRLDNSNNEFIPKGGYDQIWNYLPDKLRTMLYDVFKLGKRYEDIEWYSALLDYKNDLISKKYSDPEAYKLFPKSSYSSRSDVVIRPRIKEPLTFSGGDIVSNRSFMSSPNSGMNQMDEADMNSRAASVPKYSLNYSSQRGASSKQEKKTFFEQFKSSFETRLIVILFLIIVVLVVIGLITW